MGSPVIDLMYFLTTSVATDIYFSHRDELIFIYHETLKLILEKLDYKGRVPTLNELQIELLQKGALGEWIWSRVGVLNTSPNI